MKVDVRTRVRGDKRREGQYINELFVEGLILYVYRGTCFVRLSLSPYKKNYRT